MMMFLMILCASLPVLGLACLVFAADRSKAEVGSSERTPAQARQIAPPAPRFFAGGTGRSRLQSHYPIEDLLSEIERHIRLEQAAAETFLDSPTLESLHTRTATPFVN